MPRGRVGGKKDLDGGGSGGEIQRAPGAEGVMLR